MSAARISSKRECKRARDRFGMVLSITGVKDLRVSMAPLKLIRWRGSACVMAEAAIRAQGTHAVVRDEKHAEFLFNHVWGEAA